MLDTGGAAGVAMGSCGVLLQDTEAEEEERGSAQAHSRVKHKHQKRASKKGFCPGHCRLHSGATGPHTSSLRL